MNLPYLPDPRYEGMRQYHVVIPERISQLDSFLIYMFAEAKKEWYETRPRFQPFPTIVWMTDKEYEENPFKEFFERVRA